MNTEQIAQLQATEKSLKDRIAELEKLQSEEMRPGEKVNPLAIPTKKYHLAEVQEELRKHQRERPRERKHEKLN